jgi:hypothetical protein
VFFALLRQRVADTTLRRYPDILEALYVVIVVQPRHRNIARAEPYWRSPLVWKQQPAQPGTAAAGAPIREAHQLHYQIGAQGRKAAEVPHRG